MTMAVAPMIHKHPRAGLIPRLSFLAGDIRSVMRRAASGKIASFLLRSDFGHIRTVTTQIQAAINAANAPPTGFRAFRPSAIVTGVPEFIGKGRGVASVTVHAHPIGPASGRHMTSRRTLVCAAAVAVAASVSSTTVYAQGSPLFALLNGGNECITTAASGQVCRKGDLDAYGTATLIFPTTTQVCFGLVFHNLAGATAAHIHFGPSAVNPLNHAVLIPLFNARSPGIPGAPGSRAGCVNTTAANVSNIRANPPGFHVHVHNDEYPDGAIRGQLF